MSENPTVVERAAQPYVSLTAHVPMGRLAAEVPPLAPQVYAWLASRGLEPAGPSFWKYNVVDMDAELEVEVGVPIAQAVDGDGAVTSGVLAAGRYVRLEHVGHPATLERATGDLLAWAGSQGLAFDVTPTEGGERWGARVEEYLNGPDDGTEPDDWTTVLLFRLAA